MITTTIKPLSEKKAAKCFSYQVFNPWDYGKLYIEKLNNVRALIDSTIAAIPALSASVGEELNQDWLTLAEQTGSLLLDKYISLLNAYYKAESRFAQDFIADLDGVSEEQMQQRRHTADQKLKDLETFQATIATCINRTAIACFTWSEVISSNTPKALDQLNKKLKMAKELHQAYIQGNELIRDHGTEAMPLLQELGLPIKTHMVSVNGENIVVVDKYCERELLAHIKQIEVSIA